MCSSATKNIEERRPPPSCQMAATSASCPCTPSLYAASVRESPTSGGAPFRGGISLFFRFLKIVPPDVQACLNCFFMQLACHGLSACMHDAPALRVVPRELALVVHPPACVHLTKGWDGILMCERRRQPGSCPPRGRTARKPQTHRSPVHGSDAAWGGGRNSLFQVRNVEIHPGHGCPGAPAQKRKKTKKTCEPRPARR